MKTKIGNILIIPQLVVTVIQQLIMIALIPLFMVIAIFKALTDNNKEKYIASHLFMFCK